MALRDGFFFPKNLSSLAGTSASGPFLTEASNGFNPANVPLGVASTWLSRQNELQVRSVTSESRDMMSRNTGCAIIKERLRSIHWFFQVVSRSSSHISVGLRYTERPGKWYNKFSVEQLS